MSSPAATVSPLVIAHKEFCRRVNYIHGHLDAVARMVGEGRDCAEVLHQMRAVRRAAEKLEANCLLAHLDAELGGLSPEAWRTLVSLYRRLNR